MSHDSLPRGASIPIPPRVASTGGGALGGARWSVATSGTAGTSGSALSFKRKGKGMGRQIGSGTSSPGTATSTDVCPLSPIVTLETTQPQDAAGRCPGASDASFPDAIDITVVSSVANSPLTSPGTTVATATERVQLDQNADGELVGLRPQISQLQLPETETEAEVESEAAQPAGSLQATPQAVAARTPSSAMPSEDSAAERQPSREMPADDCPPPAYTVPEAARVRHTQSSKQHTQPQQDPAPQHTIPVEKETFSRHHTTPAYRTPGHVESLQAAVPVLPTLAASGHQPPPSSFGEKRPRPAQGYRTLTPRQHTPRGQTTPRGMPTPRGSGCLTPNKAGASPIKRMASGPLPGSKDSTGLVKQIARRGERSSESAPHARPTLRSLAPPRAAATPPLAPRAHPGGMTPPPAVTSPTSPVQSVHPNVNVKPLPLGGSPSCDGFIPLSAQRGVPSPVWTPRETLSRSSSHWGSPALTPGRPDRPRETCESNVTVLLRVRAFTATELRSGAAAHDLPMMPDANGSDVVVETANKAMNGGATAAQIFSFDRVLWSVEDGHHGGATQSDVFHEAGVPAIEALLRGFNVCLLAYGQTGSGKTYTIMGEELRDAGGREKRASRSGSFHKGLVATPPPAELAPPSLSTDSPTAPPACLQNSFSATSLGDWSMYDNPATPEKTGLLPRVMQGLFVRCTTMGETTRATFEVSFIEIYNERVKDLLTKPRNGTSAPGSHHHHHHDVSSSEYQQLKVRQHPVKGVFVDGVVKATVSSWEECHELVARGAAQRATAATLVNDKSSRSHAIFSLTVTIADVATVGGRSATTQRTSSLHVVDLAGSERQSRSGATGQTLEEASGINLSLTVLRKVIDALVDRSHGRDVIAPVRESMLTWVLSDSLGGNSKTTMIATVSPTRVSVEESLSTLRYAVKARGIVNKVRVNESSHGRIIRELKEELERLRVEENSREQCSSALADKIAMNESALAEVKALAATLQRAHVKQLRAEQDKRQKAETQTRELARRLEAAEAALHEQRTFIMQLQSERAPADTEQAPSPSEAKCSLCSMM